jgi:hypothetical protein
MQTVAPLEEEEEKKKCAETGILLTLQLMDPPHIKLQCIATRTTPSQ